MASYLYKFFYSGANMIQILSLFSANIALWLKMHAGTAPFKDAFWDEFSEQNQQKSIIKKQYFVPH